MMKMFAFAFAFLFVAPVWAHGPDHGGSSDGNIVGTVHFPISCRPSTLEPFDRAVAMLHSFWYDEAEKSFRQITATDPDCAMAYWGVAMSLYHQLWATPPKTEELQKGWDAVRQARKLDIKTEREKAYVAAVEAFYRDPEHTDYGARKLAYTQAMEQVMVRYPEDSEAAVFYALALISTASPKDKTYANQKKALALLQKVLKAEPNHPGVAHYIIHASDYPELAGQGLEAAEGYARIAPAVPHALHMPSHIFIRLGYWQDAARSNLAAYRAAKDYARKNALRGAWDQQMHYMDYLVYAYLQIGQMAKAKAIVQELRNIKKVQPENTTTAYAFAAIPARYAVERGKWSEAARLEVKPADFPWGEFGWCEAITHFARGLGAARSGDLGGASSSLRRLEALRDADRAAGRDYTSDQIEIQRLAVAAWIAHGEKKDQDAEKLMRASADLEDSIEKDNVTPGAIVPARELLGELLLELKRPQEAYQAFESSLARAPNRRNGLHGAVVAAKSKATARPN